LTKTNQTEHIGGYLSHRHSIMVDEVMIANGKRIWS